jgi:hypothetical protein
MDTSETENELRLQNRRSAGIGGSEKEDACQGNRKNRLNNAEGLFRGKIADGRRGRMGCCHRAKSAVVGVMMNGRGAVVLCSSKSSAQEKSADPDRQQNL